MRVLADVSSHGFGHIMQTSCVLAALGERTGALTVRLRTGLKPEAVRRFVEVDTFGPAPLDPTLQMSAPDTIDVAGTALSYARFPEAFAAAVAEAEAEIDGFRPDLVFSDIPAPGLVAARRKGIAAVALCSLNWADVLPAVLPEGTIGAEALGLLEDAYRGADVFFLPEPSMPMPPRPNQRVIGPIGRFGRPCPERIKDILGLDDRPLGLLSWGGWGGSVDAGFLASLPDDIAWISEAGPLMKAGIPHIDVLASSAIVIAKPGYGTFVEAIANRVRLVHTDRPGWPETAALTAWARRHGAAREIHKASAAEEAADAIRALMAETPPAPPPLTGALEAADFICDQLLAGQSLTA